jgi:hypothetical protein
MRHRHALYLSQAMTERLQVVSETHRLSKSQILEAALQKYLAIDHADQSNDLRNLQQQPTVRRGDQGARAASIWMRMCRGRADGGRA